MKYELTKAPQDSKSIFEGPLYNWHFEKYCADNKLSQLEMFQDENRFDHFQEMYVLWHDDMTTRQAQVEIEVSLQVEGFHNFPKAVEMFGYDVQFLADQHRHIFHISLRKKVAHDDRDVEFILFKRQVQKYLIEVFGDKDQICQFGPMSCEAIARLLSYQFNCSQVRVFEDNENGAIVTI